MAAAIVNGTVISKNRVEMMVRQNVGAGQSDTPEMRKSITDKLILQMLVVEDAIKKGLDKSPEVIEQIEMTKQSALANAYVQDYIKNNMVNDDMLKAEYDKIKATISGSEYKIRHILVEKEDEALEIITELKKNPEAFGKIAMEKSQDAKSAPKGGEIGWVDLNKVVPEFGTVVAKMGKGTFTEVPVKTQFGYDVILLEDSKPKEVPPFDDVKANLAQRIQMQNMSKHLDDLKSKAKIEIMETPAAAGK